MGYVGGGDAIDPAMSQDGGEYSGPRAEVERGAAAATKWSMGDQVDVLASDRGEDAVVGMHASVEEGYFNAVEAPLVCPDHAQQLVEWLCR
ncbi:hypothetical protein AB0C18_38610 [Nonomuraea muscovyensis]|uniref:hypothetical protein n=1 Tax=Nonomuraea muscovyensis TaxID=1124761 RepID=UPI00340B7B69